jgi:hypothetical protein
MKLTKKSKLLMSFFLKNKYMQHSETKNATNKILYQLYDEILNAYKYLQMIKKTKGHYFYSVNVKKITSISQITKPKIFNANSFPEKIRTHIDESVILETSFTFSLSDREIKVYFLDEEDNSVNQYNKYIDAMIMWLYILNEHASQTCSKTLAIYVYFTKLEKMLPSSNVNILDEHNVNTAFTTTCPRDSEIVIFRKEELLKVFMHETMHNFGLDFSNMNNDDCRAHILSIFPVNSEVNLYEAYAEFWAEIMNSLFCSFYFLKNKNDINNFIKNALFFIHFERTYSFFQLVKTLNFMGLTYKDLYSKTEKSAILRKYLYKEDSNVLSYYIIKAILINSYQDFLFWCKQHNISLLQFKKTPTNQREFCKFIEKKYKTTQMLQSVEATEIFMKKISILSKTNNKNMDYLVKNMRMSICELG